MANLSDQTRKEQVLAYLSERKGAWVDGTEIMNERVGGQRGGARIKDLRDDGYVIQSRKHPDPERDIWQYKLVDRDPLPIREEVRDEPELPTKTPEATKFEFGMVIICPVCKARRKRCDNCHNKGYIPNPRVF